MLKLLYDSGIDDEDAVVAKVKTMPVPQDMGIVLMTRAWGNLEKAKGTPYEGRIHATDSCMYYVPGLWPHELFQATAYDHVQPVDAITLYYDGIDVCAEVEHPCGTRHVIVRFLPKGAHAEAWKYLGRTNGKAWRKVMRHTVPANEAMPGLMSLARPCRLVPVGTDA